MQHPFQKKNKLLLVVIFQKSKSMLLEKHFRMKWPIWVRIHFRWVLLFLFDIEHLILLVMIVQRVIESIMWRSVLIIDQMIVMAMEQQMSKQRKKILHHIFDDQAEREKVVSVLLLRMQIMMMKKQSRIKRKSVVVCWSIIAVRELYSHTNKDVWRFNEEAVLVIVILRIWMYVWTGFYW